MVLGQVVFSPVLDMPDRISAIQAALREYGFVKLDVSEMLVRVQVKSGTSTPQIETSTRWEFRTRDDTWALALTRDFVVLQTSRYSLFEAFAALLGSVLHVLESESDVAWVTRLGLRYFNLVQPEDDEAPLAYLHEGLRGLEWAQLGTSVGQLDQFFTQSQVPTRSGVLTLRTMLLQPNTWLTPDLSGTTLAPPLLLKPDQHSMTLDLDHADLSERDFEAEAILDRFFELHDILRMAFRIAVTDHAMTKWGPEQEVAIA